MIPPPPTSTLFPYTTLFRSEEDPYPVKCAETLRRVGIPFEKLTTSDVHQRFPQIGLDRISWALLEPRSEEHTSELQSRPHLVCRLLLEKKKQTTTAYHTHNS